MKETASCRLSPIHHTLCHLVQCIICATIVMAAVGCSDKRDGHEEITLESFSGLADPQFRMDTEDVRKGVLHMVREDTSSLFADRQAKRHYRSGGRLLWIDRHGVRQEADTLLRYLKEVGDMGFTPRSFRTEHIAEDLQRARTLRFDSTGNCIQAVMARLEYNLTKAYVNYVTGLQFGFVNPGRLLNRIDPVAGDSTGREFQRLFDIPVKRPDEAYCTSLLDKVRQDSAAILIRQAQPRSAFYRQLKDAFAQSATRDERIRALCNMERCRWKTDDQPEMHDKYVMVNIAAQQLEAVDGDSTLTMRIVCGAMKTKTPLLTSRMMRIDVNPQWIIPRSIVEHEVMHHVGDSAYFARNNYFVMERQSGKRIPQEEVTAQLLKDKGYLVVQEGGEGNSLGRIIFRFDNNFSVFLHDTSNPAAFARSRRTISHGCVRVEKPFELARFLLGPGNGETLDRIDYSMKADLHALADPNTPQTEKPDRKKLINSVKVEPQVPLYIAYYTLYPDRENKGRLRKYEDIYGYDNLIYKQLTAFMK
ncbi:MAG: L,D-transpeptidase family protein [Prevotella sp.]